MLYSIKDFYRSHLFKICLGGTRREHNTARVLCNCGQLSELLARGGASEDNPACGQPPDKHARGRAGREALPPHQQERAPDSGGLHVHAVRGRDTQNIRVFQGSPEGDEPDNSKEAHNRLPQHGGTAPHSPRTDKAARTQPGGTSHIAADTARHSGEPALGRGAACHLHL